jgi:hypothetical protein
MDDKRNLAIERGLQFIYQTACNPENFELYGHDYLGCFHCIASTSKNRRLRRTAREMGRERARQWRREHSKVPPDVDAEDIATLVFGSYAADNFGVRDDRLKDQIRKAAGRFTALDYYCFDPASEPPPRDVPDECECEASNPRGRKTCCFCRKRLTMMSPYAVWLDALTRSYTGERYGIKLATPFMDVIKWLPAMRPYPSFVDVDEKEFYDAVYAVTHVVYTLNGYSSYQLSPRWLPIEYSFLKRNLVQAIVMEDPETVGEFLDSLKSFGLPEDHSLILRGVKYLLAEQNPDGSWGDTEAEDIYERYHPTWTAIDGLREYAWRGKRLCFPELAPLLEIRQGKRLR